MGRRFDILKRASCKKIFFSKENQYRINRCKQEQETEMKKMNYTFRDRRKNDNHPKDICSVTALSHALSCVGLEVDPDELYIKASSPGYLPWPKRLGAWIGQYITGKRLNQTWAVLKQLADEYLGESEGGTFKDYRLTIDEMVDYLEKGCPVLVGGKFTRNAHIICLAGYTEKHFIAADSRGDWMSQYRDHNGKDVMYPFHEISLVLHGKNKKYRALVICKK